jgi:hypothetical protein
METMGFPMGKLNKPTRPGKHPKHDTGNQHFSWLNHGKSRVSKCCDVHPFSSQAANVYQMKSIQGDLGIRTLNGCRIEDV